MLYNRIQSSDSTNELVVLLGPCMPKKAYVLGGTGIGPGHGIHSVWRELGASNEAPINEVRVFIFMLFTGGKYYRI